MPTTSPQSRGTPRRTVSGMPHTPPQPGTIVFNGTHLGLVCHDTTEQRTYVIYADQCASCGSAEATWTPRWQPAPVLI